MLCIVETANLVAPHRPSSLASERCAWGMNHREEKQEFMEFSHWSADLNFLWLMYCICLLWVPVDVQGFYADCSMDLWLMKSK